MLNKAKIFSVTSVKGGTGKTINTLNLAGTFSKMNKKTLIIDLDLNSCDVAAMLNIDPNRDLYTMFVDVTNNRFDSIDDYVTKYNDNIDVISSPKDPRYSAKITGKFINLLIYKVQNKYDVILIDMNYILNEINLVSMDLSDEIIYVLNNSPMDIKNMKTMVSIYNDMNKYNYKILLYDAKHKDKNVFTNFDIKNIVKKNISYKIPDSFYIRDIDKYILDGIILTLDKRINSRYKKTIDIYNKIATDLLRG